MGIIFQRGRRETGSIVLLVAVFLVLGWVTSLGRMDSKGILIGRTAEYRILSYDGCLGAHVYEFNIAMTSLNDGKSNWVFKARGFNFGTIEYHNGRAPTRLSSCAVPYWFVTIPSILLSAWLLLKRPHNVRANQFSL